LRPAFLLLRHSSHASFEVIMAVDRQTILTWLADLAATIVNDADDASDIARRLSAASALEAVAFANEILSLMRIIAESVTVAEQFGRISTPDTAEGDTRSAFDVLVALGTAVSGCRVGWPSRPSARGARSRVSLAGDAGLSAADKLGANGADLYGWLQSVTGVSVRYISDIAADAAPVVKIKTGISLPSTVIAYQLYGDAARAGAMVDLSRAATPMVMPTTFDALAS
jgi:hypothetical protein